VLVLSLIDEELDVMAGAGDREVNTGEGLIGAFPFLLYDTGSSGIVKNLVALPLRVSHDGLVDHLSADGLTWWWNWLGPEG
jgi:hypothetical protein